MFKNLRYNLWLHLNKEFKPKRRQKYKLKIIKPKMVNITKGCCDMCLQPKDNYLYFGKKEVGLCDSCLVKFHDEFNMDYEKYINDLNTRNNTMNEKADDIVYVDKPCVKCGGKGVLHTTYDTERVECESCGAKTRTEVGDYYDEACMDGSYVIPKWNKGEIL